MIRNACISDVPEIHKMLLFWADRKLLLGRSISSLYDQLRDFVVFDDAEQGVIGVCALHICWENLAEIRSLAVREDRHGQGIGGSLVKHCLDDARALGIKKVFTLTYQAGFFRRMAFHEIDKQELPHKIWSDCINCPHFPDCNEEAFLREV